MKKFILLLCTIFLASSFHFTTCAQKTIYISDQLSFNSNPLKVKMGAQSFGKIWNFRFGDYAIEKSKQGWVKTTSKTNLFDTKTESKSTQKFSFSMIDKSPDTAYVNAAINIEYKALQGFEIFPGFRLGDYELLLSSNNFTASITINKDTANTWLLIMKADEGTEIEENVTSVLTNGARKVDIHPVTSIQNGDTRSVPALGYEFSENGLPVCAVQYYGGGMMGQNKNIVWIHNNLDQKMKLTLAAAITAILQLKNSSTAGIN